MIGATGLADLTQSERGVFAILALVCATVLAVIGVLAIDNWLDFVKYLAVTLIASKTITTAVETFTTKKPQIPTPPSADDQKG